MPGIKTILAALDLEAGCDSVLFQAMQLASAHAARLVVLHVVEADSLAQVAALSERSETDLGDDLRHHALSTIEASVLKSGNVGNVDRRVEFGIPHEVVSRVAGEEGADIIVVGPGKGRSFKEKVLGSTADRVIRSAPVSVLVVRSGSPVPYGRVAVAVDFSAPSAAAVKEARRLAPQATMQLLHAAELPPTFAQAMLRAGTSRLEIERYRAARRQKARAVLAAFAREAAGAAKVDLRIVDGAAGPALVRLSRGGRVDLIAMGPHGHGIVHQALLGSVTQRVLRQAACDVLVARG